jgi:hypothetical protein
MGGPPHEKGIHGALGHFGLDEAVMLDLAGTCAMDRHDSVDLLPRPEGRPEWIVDAIFARQAKAGVAEYPGAVEKDRPVRSPNRPDEAEEAISSDHHAVLVEQAQGISRVQGNPLESVRGSVRCRDGDDREEKNGAEKKRSSDSHRPLQRASLPPGGDETSCFNMQGDPGTVKRRSAL